jgi:ubiquinone/menaquinone biosynthesis C-methylase UbiE
MAQGKKPAGLLGRLVGYLMNLSHRGTYNWGLANLPLDDSSAVLDVGCGGGELVKLLARRMPRAKVWGIDHSPEMVSLSRSANRSLIRSGRVQIDLGSVSSLPYADNAFDVVTAFESIQFWPDLKADLQEVQRVLKPSGRFVIVNRYPDLEGDESNWAEYLKIHSSAEYRQHLTGAGYVGISIDERSRPGWILVSASKPQELPLSERSHDKT